MAKPEDITMEGVRLIFRNFSGKEGMYNAAGNRNFHVIIDEDLARTMEADGWKIRWPKPREDGEVLLPSMEVKVNFGSRKPPLIVMIGDKSRRRTELDEETVGLLDFVEFANVDLKVHPYEWDVNGNTGIKAYLAAIYVTIVEDVLELKYANLDADELSASASLQSPPWDE
jgi:hypothetical protein